MRLLLPRRWPRELILGCGIWACAAAARADDAVPPAAPIAVIVPAALGEAALDADVLAQIYRRKKLLWDDGARVVPVNLPADSPLRRQFSRAVLRQSPEALEDYWNQQYFQGVLPPHVLASEAAVLRFVAETEHAIGYLSACAVDVRVRVLMIIDVQGRIKGPDTPVECPPPS